MLNYCWIAVVVAVGRVSAERRDDGIDGAIDATTCNYCYYYYYYYYQMIRRDRKRTDRSCLSRNDESENHSERLEVDLNREGMG